MAQVSHCGGLAVDKVHNCLGKTPEDRKGKRREGSGAGVDIDLPFMQINAS